MIKGFAKLQTSDRVLGQIQDNISLALNQLIVEFRPPAGSILAFAGSKIPDSYLPCDGSQYLKTRYPDLYTSLGDLYATQWDNENGANFPAPAQGYFRVPDYRGIFLRGVGNPISVDPVLLGERQTQKTAVLGLTASTTTTTIAKSQWSQNTLTESANHTHTWQLYAYDYSYDGIGTRGNINAATGTADLAIARLGTGYTGPYAMQTSGISVNHVHQITFTGNATGTTTAPTLTGDNETRPRNKGVNYIIRY